jgi:hypothetical protein
LLFDPVLPTAARTNAPFQTMVLLDASLSMQLPTSGNRTRWDEAVDRLNRTSGSPGVLLMGGAPRQVARDSAAGLKPMFAESRLLPALQAAGEGGAEKVIVITDGGIEDLQEVRRWLPRLGLDVQIERVGATSPSDAGIAELTAPAWVEAGKPVQVRIGLSNSGPGGNSARVSVRSSGTVLGTAAVPLAESGRISTASIDFNAPSPPGGGLVRLEVILEPSDAIAANNSRTFYIQVGEKPAGVAIVSFKPDWETRFLHPILEQSLGLPVRSFLRATGSQFVQGGSGVEAGKRSNEEDVRNAVTQADLLVVHGAAADIPAWALEALRTKPRTLVFPGELGFSLAGEIDLPQATPGDWYISDELPSSPIASLLAGLPTENLPPLMAVLLPRELPSTAWIPLQATRGRRGVQAPVVIATAAAGKRRVVALGIGFWRWAFRGGEQRQVYARFWGALAGWLVQEQGQIAAGAVRPASRVIEQGGRPAWIAPGLNADSVNVRLFSGQAMVADSTIPLEQADTALSSVLPPGNYRYEARAFAGGREVGSGAGPLTVDTYSREFGRLTHSLGDLTGAAGTSELGQNRRGARPLRTLIWPYLLVVGLLVTEWTLRRRWGLR